MADLPYQKAPGALSALVAVVVLAVLALVAFLAANGELYRWM
jgi:VIT1/CCC1 family predicted Fe2+/Mn2+ transporter